MNRTCIIKYENFISNFCKGITLACLLQLCFLTLQAQTLKVSAKTDRLEYLIGDYITLQINATYAANEKLQLPEIKDSLGGLDILTINDTISQVVEDQQATSWTIILAGYDSAEYTIPSLRFTTNRGSFVNTDTITIMVKSVPVKMDQGIAPPQPIIILPKSWKEYLPYFIYALILFLALIFIYFKFIKKKVQQIETKITIPEMSPKQWAEIELEKLRKEQLWQQGEVKLYYSRVSEILREYIERRFGLPALESTTDEILDVFKKSVHGYGKERIKMEKILTIADLVKFAKVNPQPAEHDDILYQTQLFVQDTTPITKSIEDTNKEIVL